MRTLLYWTNSGLLYRTGSASPLIRVQHSGRRLTALLVTALLLLGALGPVALATDTAPAAPAPAAPFTLKVKSALLMDAATGQVLMEQNADEPLPLASVTKLITLRLAFKALHDGKIKLDQPVVVSENAWAGRLAGSSLMFLKPGDQVTVKDLLYGITVDSGNDACIAMAETIAGSVDVFVKQMNDEAASLGLQHANFVDPHGLSPEDQMSARDVATDVQSYLQKYPEALTYHSTKEFTYGVDVNSGKPITQPNRNGLLWSYPGADGLKTGHTSEAGYNLVGTAKRGDMRLIAVVLGTPDIVDGRSGEKYREQAVAQMFNWGFASFADYQPTPPGATVAQLTVYKGSQRQVAVVPKEAVVVTIPKGNEKGITSTVKLNQSYVAAPVKKGQTVGTLTLSFGGQELKRVDLVAAADVPRGGFFRVIWDSLRLLFARVFHRK